MAYLNVWNRYLSYFHIIRGQSELRTGSIGLMGPEGRSVMLGSALRRKGQGFESG